MRGGALMGEFRSGAVFLQREERGVCFLWEGRVAISSRRLVRLWGLPDRDARSVPIYNMPMSGRVCAVRANCTQIFLARKRPLRPLCNPDFWLF